MLDNKDKEYFQTKQGFVPPGIMVAENFGDEFQETIQSYHKQIWDEGVIPLKYRYMIAMATAIFDDNEQRAKLEMRKAIDSGASREELLEVIQQQIWMKGAPTILQVAPLIQIINKKLPKAE
ncbi:carboxymuconolactone decarboxylase family protein [Acidaminobacter sp. JC074]|uniref:carboxymuconolactone decarboxylase family protein n=1 Tax=Acidaminobacter sp. JC074 TaxID=2530199 RepID=UPI001F107AC0|nr:carboxymuconolactone decarboxylase family protein [Acidaminobacter sp. JC074]MCH4888577.1 carboxymuconolactone decarboxylase family protein [Acidaminobacter sp. JC074]